MDNLKDMNHTNYVVINKRKFDIIIKVNRIQYNYIPNIWLDHNNIEYSNES